MQSPFFPLLQRFQALLPHAGAGLVSSRVGSQTFKETPYQASATRQSRRPPKASCPRCGEKHRRHDLVRHWASKRMIAHGPLQATSLTYRVDYPDRIRCRVCSKTQRASVFMTSDCVKDKSIGHQQYEMLCTEIESQMGIPTQRSRKKAQRTADIAAHNSNQIDLPTSESQAPRACTPEPTGHTPLPGMPAIASHAHTHSTTELHSLFDMPEFAEPMLHDLWEQTIQDWDVANVQNSG